MKDQIGNFRLIYNLYKKKISQNRKRGKKYKTKGDCKKSKYRIKIQEREILKENSIIC